MPNYQFTYKDTIFCSNSETASEECMKILKKFVEEDINISEFCEVKEIEH